MTDALPKEGVNKVTFSKAPILMIIEELTKDEILVYFNTDHLEKEMIFEKSMIEQFADAFDVAAKTLRTWGCVSKSKTS